MSRRRAFLVGSMALCGLVAVLVISLVTGHTAKRGRPPLVKPVTVAGVEYRAPNTYSSEGIIEAWDSNTKKLLWRKKIYLTLHIPLLVEEDNQWNFIRFMTNGPTTNALSIVSENGRRYILDTASQKVTGK